mmetsp:Transcript_23756/g.55358  ORF Transcript_23756/g.55358 Transcript_23756/m.55358 type:complete len:243 (-) Transcript_23756:86-814(-)
MLPLAVAPLSLLLLIPTQASAAPLCNTTCCSGAFPSESAWTSKVSPSGLVVSDECGNWTAQASAAHLELKDSVNCGGNCERAVQAIAFTTISFYKRTRVLMTAHGNGRPWWEDVQVYIDGRLVHTFPFGTGKMPSACNSAEAVVEPAQVHVEAGKRLVEVKVTTGDPLFHKAGYLSIMFTDAGARGCEDLCLCPAGTASTPASLTSQQEVPVAADPSEASKRLPQVRRVAVSSHGSWVLQPG